ncbi:MAG: tRNA A37 threonylcarbamoyladenosine dehydratase [Algoriphagus sp.]|jgi:tRNA A37 threonylcarbamoyladenosine dehydratase
MNDLYLLNLVTLESNMSINYSFESESQIYPKILSPVISSDWEEIVTLRDSKYVSVVDQIDSQIADLIKADNAEHQFTKEGLKTLVDEFFEKNDKEKYGNWIFFPWKSSLVHILPEKEFIKVRTLRNNFKIAPSEQNELSTKKIGIIGLSVGQSVALAMSLERSFGEIRLADFDILELSNLNRLKAGVTSLGIEKSVIAAREISEIDPYLKISLFREGINEENVENFILENGKLDLLIDECDSLDIKFLLREKAKFFRVPVIMETSDRGMLDIERFDIEPDRKIFHGMVQEIDRNELKNLTNKERVSIVLKITGLETLSARMKASLLEIGQSITSWPQLASGVFLGGASVAHVGRRLLLGDQVPSGRFYVDFDEIIKIDQAEIFDILPSYPVVSESINRIKSILPQHVLQSGYILSKIELSEILSHSNMAPSGGNVQPWIWVFDKKGLLHLFHDKYRSESMLDFKGSGSLIAFGAALENLRLTSAKMGLEIELIIHIVEFEEDCIATVRFISKFKNSIKVKNWELVEGIGLRCTNRKNNQRQEIKISDLDILKSFAEEEGFFLKFKKEDDELEKLAEVVGGMDRMRFFHEQGLADFIKEVRWTEKDANELKDGIDIATLELSGTERAAMGLLKDPRTARFFRKFLMGYGLTKISKDTLTTSSAVLVIGSKEYSAREYLKAGQVLQRVWIKANMMGISFQPISAMLFIFHKVSMERNNGFTKGEEIEVNKFKAEFDKVFEMSKSEKSLFMFRINEAGEPSVRALRRDIEDTLIVI